MYFWRIFKLRQQLAETPLPAAQAVSYLIAFLVVGYAIVIGQAWFGFYPKLHWMPVYYALMGVIELTGVYYCYRANGGSKGSGFLAKFFALAWVLFCRFVVFGIIVLGLGMFLIELFTQQHQLVTPHYWWVGVFFLFWLMMFYWRLVVHVKKTV